MVNKPFSPELKKGVTRVAKAKPVVKTTTNPNPSGVKHDMSKVKGSTKSNLKSLVNTRRATVQSKKLPMALGSSKKGK